MGEFNQFLTEDNQNSRDFKRRIDESANLYLKRHPECPAEEASNFIIEEMAYLTVLAKKHKVNYFIYKGKELEAFTATRQHFLADEADLLKWAELSFVSSKRQKKAPPVFSMPTVPNVPAHLVLTALLMSELPEGGPREQFCSLLEQMAAVIATGHKSGQPPLGKSAVALEHFGALPSRSSSSRTSSPQIRSTSSTSPSLSSTNSSGNLRLSLASPATDMDLHQPTTPR